MREIEFRGKIKYIPGYFGCSKDKNDGEWVYGDLERHRIDELVRIHCYSEDKKYYRQYDVDPNTVGQFTGLLDKNGKKIFEGDVIKCGLRLYVCEFIEGGFEFRDLSDGKLVLKAIVNQSCLIGNIHDNPELIN